MGGVTLKLKFKLLEFRRQLADGSLPESRPQLAIVLGWALNFFLGLFLALAPLFGGCGPFGIAIAAQAGAQISGLCCALGASVGYLAAFSFDEAIKYVAAVVLIFTAGYVFQDLRIYGKSFFMPAMTALFSLLTGMLSDFERLDQLGIYGPMFAETVLAGGSAYFFREALRSSELDTESAELRHGIAVTILLSCLLMALSKAEVIGVFSLGRSVAVILVMIAAFKGGALSGAAAGTCLGLAMDIASGGDPYNTFVYAFSGLTAGIFSRHGRLVFVLSFVVAGAAAALTVMADRLRMYVFYEFFVGAVIFMVLPGNVCNVVGAFLKPAQLSAGESGMRKYAARRIEGMGKTLKELYQTLDKELSNEHNDEDISKIFDRAAGIVCEKCKNKNECWNGNYMDTVNVFNDVTPAIRQRGSLLKSDMPKHFAQKCSYVDELVSAINGELRGQMYRKQFSARLAENRSAAYGQYFDLSEILQDVAEELQNAYGPDVLAQRRLLRYLNSINVEADVSVFRDRSGRLHIIMESARLGQLLKEPLYLDKLSNAVGVRLCRPNDGNSAQGRICLLEAEPLSACVGIASMKKKGESVSGDRGTYFKTDHGVLCIILSDGMGSGQEAARESIAAVRILEGFLRAGVEPAIAMKMLNSMMLLKNGDEWGFATVDLVCIDLFTGETVFYKYGAAPSYVRTGKTVRRVRSENLAAGLSVGEENMPDIVRMHLKPGGIAIIASDGVIAETNDAWVRTLITQFDGGDAKELARQALQTAYSLYGAGDDMTVLAVKLEKRA